MQDIEQERDAARGELAQTKIELAFARSRFVAETLNIPADIAAVKFGESFKFENGRTVGYDLQGRPIMRSDNPAEFAEFDEALKVVVAAYPFRDAITRGHGQGAALSRAAFGALPADLRMKHVKAGGSIVD